MELRWRSKGRCLFVNCDIIISEGIPPRTWRLKGLLKPKEPLAADWDYRDLLEERMVEKSAAD